MGFLALCSARIRLEWLLSLTFLPARSHVEALWTCGRTPIQQRLCSLYRHILQNRVLGKRVHFLKCCLCRTFKNANRK